MARSAVAVFDLDRTLISTSSALVFRKHLAEAGLGGSRELPLADVLSRFYEQFGENWLMMQPARLASRSSAGWLVNDVEAAMKPAAEELAELVLPFARETIEEHRRAGDLLVLATTSPRPFVEPFARQLGFDGVVATEWEIDGDSYTGAMDGGFIWGRAKADAVERWAHEHGVNLKKSSAYSDSYFDAPLLALVGNPVAVNPDLQLRATAAIRGWPVRYFDKADGVAKIAGREIQEWTRPLMRPELLAPNADIEFEGVENIPAEGGVILVFNHRSYFDPTVMGLLIAKAGRNVRGLGKKEVFDVPIIGRLMRAAGGIRVDRGTGSDEPLEAAAESIRGGELLMLAPEGTNPRGPAGGRDRRAGDPGRVVGHREGLAPQLAAAAHVAQRPPQGHRHGRQAGQAEVRRPRRRHEADHEGDHQAPAARGPRQADPHRGGTRAHVPARVQG